MELGGKGKITHKFAGVKSSFSCFASFSSPTKLSERTIWHIDKKTAMTYINKLRGTHSHRLTYLTLEMWNFAADRSLTLSAVYVPGKENQIADKKSRVFQDSLESVSGITKRSWLFRYRSLCNTCEPSGSCVCQLETRAWRSCHRCKMQNVKMEFSTGLPIPPSPLLYDQKCLRKFNRISHIVS